MCCESEGVLRAAEEAKVCCEMAKKKARILDCDTCGEPVALSEARFVALVAAGERPRCRKNGCERFSGAKNTRTDRGTEVLATEGDSLFKIEFPRFKKGRKNGALAKLRVNQMRIASCGASSGNG